MATADLIPTAPNADTSVLVRVGQRYGVDPGKVYSTLIDTVFKGATQAQAMALLIVADQHHLNPFTREIYAFPDKQSGGIVPVVGIDGWIRIVNEHPMFDGCEFEYADDFSWCAAIMYRKDRTRPIVVREYLTECRRKTAPWDTSPRRMLRHRAYAQCARLAFGFAAYLPDEAEAFVDGQAKPALLRPPQRVQPTPPAPPEFIADADGVLASDDDALRDVDWPAAPPTIKRSLASYMLQLQRIEDSESAAMLVEEAALDLPLSQLDQLRDVYQARWPNPAGEPSED